MKPILLATASLLLVSNLGCGKSSNSNADGSFDTSTASVVAGGTSNAAASSDDSGGSPVAFQPRFTPLHKINIIDLLIPKANAAACLSSAKVKAQACTGTTMTLGLGSCSAGGAAFSGSYTLTFNSAGACTAASGGGMMSMGAGNSMTMTSSGAGVTRMAGSGASVNTTSDSSGFSAPVSGGITTTCTSADCSSGAGRSVVISGIHRSEFAASGKQIYDHTLNTSSPFVITGTGANRVISSGTLVLQHNLAKYIATSTVSVPLTFSAGCCFPTGGQMTTSYSNGRTGSETLIYGGVCGTASANGNAITLSHCQ